MIVERFTEAGPLLLLAQDRSQPSSNELVDGGECVGMRLFEVIEPSP